MTANYGSTARPRVLSEPSNYPQRWKMLALLSILSSLNQMICYTYAPIATSAERYWNKNLTSTNLVTIYFISYIPFSFMGSWMLDKYGLRTGMIVGGSLQALGAIIRWVGPAPHRESYMYAVVGQIIASLGMPFMVNSPSLLSSIWFPSNERALSTSTSVNANALGIALAYFGAPLFVQIDDDIVVWEGIIALLSVVALLCTMVFFEESPNLSPGKGMLLNLSSDYDWKQWIRAFHYPGFTTTVICFSVSECLLNGFSSLLNKFLVPVGFSKTHVGIVGGLFIISALVGSQIVCRHVDKTRAFTSTTQACLWGSIISLAAFKLSMAYPGEVNTFLALMATGFFVGPLQALVLELGVECAHPTSEATVAALQQLCGNLLSAIMVPLMSQLHHNYKDKSSGHVPDIYFYACPEWIMVFLLAISLVPFLCFNDSAKLHNMPQHHTTGTIFLN